MELLPLEELGIVMPCGTPGKPGDMEGGTGGCVQYGCPNLKNPGNKFKRD